MERLSEDTVADILLRLPSKSILRSGAMCKAWRRITTAPHFLAARAPPPLSIIVCTDLYGTRWPHLALDAVPVSSSDAEEDAGAGRHRLIRYTNAPFSVRPHCLLLASCDGVLLFGTDAGGYLLCNPVTRQWAELPRLPDEYSVKDLAVEHAFYFHRPSGELRLLCCSLQRRVWYVVASTGSGSGEAEPRHLKAIDDPSLIPKLMDSRFMTTALHGNLHWPPLELPDADHTEIIVFDTVSETFGSMPGPQGAWAPKWLKLFQMGELLAAADFGQEEHVDLWVLEDYGAAGRWVRRHRVATPWNQGKERPRGRSAMQSVAAAADGGEGNVVILGNSKGLEVYDTRRGEAAGRSVGSVMRREFVTRHVFQGSMVEHACFGPPPTADSPFLYF